MRIAALFALDHVATRGAPDAIAKIEALKAAEEGRAIWASFGPEAMMLRARLRRRTP